MAVVAAASAASDPLRIPPACSASPRGRLRNLFRVRTILLLLLWWRDTTYAVRAIDHRTWD